MVRLADYRTRTVLRIHLELQIIHSLFFIKNSFERPRRRPCRVAGVKFLLRYDHEHRYYSKLISTSKQHAKSTNDVVWLTFESVAKFDEKHR